MPFLCIEPKHIRDYDRNFLRRTTGSTEAVAQDIAKQLGIADADVHNVADASADETDKYDLLVLGSPTWGNGDLQDDWYGFLDRLKTRDLTGRKVALFGCGDSGSYPDTFCDAVGLLYEELQPTGCIFVAPTNPRDTTSRTRSSAPTAGS